MTSKIIILSFAVLSTMGCGLKVVKQNPNEGTMAVDYSGGTPKLVGTYTCTLNAMTGKFSAIGKSEAEARDEVLARCRDKTLISICEAKDTKCVKN